MVRKRLLALLIPLMFIPAVSLGAEGFRYDAHGKRDPMVPLIGQEKAAGAMIPISEAVSIDDLRLEGIVAQASGHSMAVMNGELVKENFKAGEVEIKKILKKSVVLTISGKEYTVNLPEEGGQKE
ncbi:MAG: hypothetical protein PHX20_07110 [Candidatus Omnitrophica bacterium]|nr:hypothetical protein [Candidatus Omnitrophota bacterium]